jgi:hypothetical protein
MSSIGPRKPINVALFSPFRWVSTLSLPHGELHTMTELAPPPQLR